ncbi:glycosyltransferase family 8 protein [Salinibacter ruber]|jgi:lipopolysaccharide biosynthesis glycosyltransferase|uniref:glycosyltransferase family 8 protein n=1 Tax=Salinibacter ruber TaxID=146919 RepID=UPI002168B281|nr:glycosyltransferase family 8 protein [Salinibacter ruber]MCS4223274.1 lipopolysaccharide biosynthesis glycosyltransferase [Salinibacter ruber]
METDAPATCLVILATDENYAAPCGVTMESLLQNTSAPSAVHFAIFGRDLPSATREKLERIAQSHGATIDVRDATVDRFQGLPLFGVESLDTYTRLYAPDEIDGFDEAIYLDCDILLEKDILELRGVDLEGSIAAAVPQGPTPFVDEFNNIHGFSEGDKYFNAGVMLIDVDKWSSRNVGDSAINWISETDRESIIYNDQDAINVVLKDKIKPIEAVWNMEARYYWEQRMGISDWWKQNARGKDLVLHYTGSQKPWDQWVYVPRQWTYRSYLEDTPFAGSGLMTRSDVAFTLKRTAAWLRMMMRVARVRGGKLTSP